MSQSPQARLTRALLPERCVIIQPSLVREFGISAAATLQQLAFLLPTGLIHQDKLWLRDPAGRIASDTGLPLQVVRWQLRYLAGLPKNGKAGGNVVENPPVIREKIMADSGDVSYWYSIDLPVLMETHARVTGCAVSVSPATESVSQATLRKPHGNGATGAVKRVAGNGENFGKTPPYPPREAERGGRLRRRNGEDGKLSTLGPARSAAALPQEREPTPELPQEFLDMVSRLAGNARKRTASALGGGSKGGAVDQGG